MAQSLFLFVQMEFPWELGPPDGRYLLRAQAGGEAEQVVVLATLAAGRRGPGRGRSWPGAVRSRPLAAQPDAAPEPALVATSSAWISAVVRELRAARAPGPRSVPPRAGDHRAAGGVLGSDSGAARRAAPRPGHPRGRAREAQRRGRRAGAPGARRR